MHRKHSNIIAFILAVIMTISIISVSTGGFGLLNVKAEQTGSDDVKVAGDISNLTGIDVNTLLNMKNEGLSWNEILEKSKGLKIEDGNNRDDRNSTLLNQSIEEDLVDQLKEEGFREEEIIEARLLIERVLFQLNEITNGEGPISEGFGVGITEEGLSAFKDLAENINMTECLPFLLRLKSDFGSYEKVLDEYLFCLQLDIDPSLYFEDKKAYLEDKNTKGLGKNRITVQSIEEKMLLKLQKENTEFKDNAQNLDPMPRDITLTKGEASNNLPDIPVPKIESVIPENPADALMNEIKEIDPMRND